MPKIHAISRKVGQNKKIHALHADYHTLSNLDYTLHSLNVKFIST